MNKYLSLGLTMILSLGFPAIVFANPECTGEMFDNPECSTEESPSETETEEHQGWRFIIKPYATIPITTFGSVTVKGRTVNYHQSLGELLDVVNYPR